MSFLHRAAGLSLRDKMRAQSSDIWERLRGKLLLLHVDDEPVELVWASGREASWLFPWGGFRAWPCRRPQGRPRTLWRDYVSGLSVPLVSWRSLWKWPRGGASGPPSSNYCPHDPDPDPDKRQKTRRNDITLYSVCPGTKAPPCGEFLTLLSSSCQLTPQSKC